VSRERPPGVSQPLWLALGAAGQQALAEAAQRLVEGASGTAKATALTPAEDALLDVLGVLDGAATYAELAARWRRSRRRLQQLCRRLEVRGLLDCDTDPDTGAVIWRLPKGYR